MLFSAPMILAMLAGIKTETRRVLNPQNTLFNGVPWSKLQKSQDWFWDAAWVDDGPSPTGNPGPYLKLPWKGGDADGLRGTAHRVYPRTQPGDLIWARETWAPVNTEDGPAFAYRSNGAVHQPEFDGKDFGAGPSFDYDKYPAEYSMWVSDLFSGVPGHAWKPSIFMPKWASRLTLPVAEVRIERLQDIDRKGALAEGIIDHRETIIWADAAFGRHREVTASGYHWLDELPYTEDGDDITYESPVDAYADLWDEINGAGSWNTNSWVIVTRYSVQHGNISEFR